jgi:hypothetical protein
VKKINKKRIFSLTTPRTRIRNHNHCITNAYQSETIFYNNGTQAVSLGPQEGRGVITTGKRIHMSKLDVKPDIKLKMSSLQPDFQSLKGAKQHQ